MEQDIELLLRAAEPLIQRALAEDLGDGPPGDATSQATLAPDAVLHGRIVAKTAGVIAGLPVAQAVFQQVDPRIQFAPRVADGQAVVPGELVAEVTGSARGLLSAERTALNFLQRMSGIATLTSAFVDAVACTRATVLDTRKTAPGHRVLDMYAVRMGGGVNHRMGLYDMIMIKDNHVDAAGGIRPAVERARATFPTLPIEVEVRNLAELQEVLSLNPPVERAMLDNMTLDQMRQAVALAGGQVPLEASGKVTLERVAEIAATGVDYISVGALTHSVHALDLSMKIARPVAGQEPLRPTAVQARGLGTSAGLDAVHAARIDEIRAALGGRLAILGHHYQRDEVLAHTDLQGDSLQLARDAAQTQAEYLVFCGVQFMAETAAVLAKPGQHVLIPDPSAGCYLADTATPEAVQAAWEQMGAVFGTADAEFTPVTYVNSSAELKAFCGRHGGIVCTSSNAERVLRWAMAQRRRVFFFPDQHLGRNTARRMGIPLGQIVLWDADRPATAGADHMSSIAAAQVVLWPGSCNVHQRFRPEHVQAARRQFPGVRVLVHPECRMEVVDLADDAGSTAYIIHQVRAAPAGTRWAIGTETRLVHRLRQEHPEQEIHSLAQVAPFCPTMAQTTVHNLAAILEGLMRAESIHEVTVDPETAHWARMALQRMLAV
jgi:quinolinate synthase